MNKTKKALLAAFACVSVFAGSAAIAACNAEGTTTPKHSHEWSVWAVTDGNKPTADAVGKATRDCSGSGDCDAAASDKEYSLPVLSSADYTVTDDTAQVGVAGTGKYKYDKDGVTVEFTAETPAKPHVHEGDGWTVTDENKPTADKKGKATRECTAADDFCNWTADDLEYELPELSSQDYEKSADTAQVGIPGEITYSYNKNGVSVEFSVETPAKPHVHEGGVWTVTDENKPTADKKGKATRECTAADEFCNWTAADLEYELPALNETDYVVSADSATCTDDGVKTYTYNKDGVNVVITVETPVNPEAHAVEHKDRFFMGCDYGGTEAHWECSLCGKMFDAEEGGNELSAGDVAIPAGHAYEMEVDGDNLTAKEICRNDGCGDVLNEYGYITNSNVGTSDDPESIKVGDYYAEISDTKNMFFKLDMTKPVVYELEFNHLTTGTVAVIMFVYLDGDTTAAGKVASGSRGAAVQANFKDVATVSHSGNQTTSFTFDATNYAGHYLKIQMLAQKSPKFTMSVKEKKPLLKDGANTISITEAYSMFVDEYSFVPTETKSYSMTVPEGVEVLMNGEDFIIDGVSANFEGTVDEKIVFAFKYVQTGAVSVTIGDAIEIPKITPDSPVSNFKITGHAVSVLEVGEVEEGTYTLTIKVPNGLMRSYVLFGKNTSENYDDYFAANGNTVAGNPAGVAFQSPIPTVLNDDYQATMSGATWTVTLDLKQGDKLLFIHSGTDGAADISMAKA